MNTNHWSLRTNFGTAEGKMMEGATLKPRRKREKEKEKKSGKKKKSNL